jgi:hypothetical protein
MSFDWSNDNPKAIAWAAFFSDCEHEVADLTSGHRITLTYNLYTTSAATPNLMRSADAESFPLYWEVKAALRNQEFLNKGGTIGFFCNHFYAQNYHKTSEVLPQALKGTDMIVHAVSKALGLRVSVRPIMDSPWGCYNMNEEEEGEEETSDNEEKYAAFDEETYGEKSGITLAPTFQRQTEQKPSAAGARSSIPQQQVTKIPPTKDNTRYTYDTGEAAPDLSHRKFEKRERLVGRGFQKFRCYDDVVGDDAEEVRNCCLLAKRA